MDRLLFHRRLQDQFEKSPFRKPRRLQGTAIHRYVGDSISHDRLLVVEDLGFDGGRQTRVLTPIERLRTVACTGIECTKAIRAQLASKWIDMKSAQQALYPALLVGQANE